MNPAKWCKVPGCRDRKQWRLWYALLGADIAPPGTAYQIDVCGTHRAQGVPRYGQLLHVERIDYTGPTQRNSSA